MTGPVATRFDAQKFARWFTRYMESERLTVADVARATGLSHSVIVTMRTGRVEGAVVKGFSITSLVKLSDALDVDVAFLLSKAGIQPSSRVSLFSLHERQLLLAATGIAAEAMSMTGAYRQAMTKLNDEIRATLTTEDD